MKTVKQRCPICEDVFGELQSRKKDAPDEVTTQCCGPCLDEYLDMVMRKDGVEAARLLLKNPKIRRITSTEAQAKRDAAYSAYHAANGAAFARLELEIALININCNGPNWLTTGKVGGWYEEEDE